MAPNSQSKMEFTNRMEQEIKIGAGMQWYLINDGSSAGDDIYGTKHGVDDSDAAGDDGGDQHHNSAFEDPC